MTKKKPKKKEVKKVKDVKGDGEEIGESPGKQFDFGGLPVRDLKKNLGCG